MNPERPLDYDLSLAMAYVMKDSMDQALLETSPAIQARLRQRADQEGIEAGREHLRDIGRILTTYESTARITSAQEAIDTARGVMVSKQSLAHFATSRNFGGSPIANYDIAGRTWGRLDAFERISSRAKASGLNIAVDHDSKLRAPGSGKVDLADIVCLLDFYHTSRQQEPERPITEVLGRNWRSTFVEFLEAFVAANLDELAQKSQHPMHSQLTG